MIPLIIGLYLLVGLLISIQLGKKTKLDFTNAEVLYMFAIALWPFTIICIGLYFLLSDRNWNV